MLSFGAVGDIKLEYFGYPFHRMFYIIIKRYSFLKI
jgi:hypothetical protein